MLCRCVCTLYQPEAIPDSPMNVPEPSWGSQGWTWQVNFQGKRCVSALVTRRWWAGLARGLGGSAQHPEVQRAFPVRQTGTGPGTSLGVLANLPPASQMGRGAGMSWSIHVRAHSSPPSLVMFSGCVEGCRRSQILYLFWRLDAPRHGQLCIWGWSLKGLHSERACLSLSGKLEVSLDSFLPQMSCIPSMDYLQNLIDGVNTWNPSRPTPGTEPSSFIWSLSWGFKSYCFFHGGRWCWEGLLPADPLAFNGMKWVTRSCPGIDTMTLIVTRQQETCVTPPGTSQHVPWNGS